MKKRETLTDFEYNSLYALVIYYGAKHVAELVEEMAAQIAADSEDES